MMKSLLRFCRVDQIPYQGNLGSMLLASDERLQKMFVSTSKSKPFSKFANIAPENYAFG